MKLEVLEETEEEFFVFSSFEARKHNEELGPASSQRALVKERLRGKEVGPGRRCRFVVFELAFKCKVLGCLNLLLFWE